VEIITGVKRRRRRWRPEEKLRVLADLEAPGASVAEVARRHDISRGLLWSWRRQVRRRFGEVEPCVGFLPMRIALQSAGAAPLRTVHAETPIDTTIEIRLQGGTTVRVGSDVTAAALRRVLTALRG
jgi:transposase